MMEQIKSLPPLPDSVIKIQELCMSSDTNIDELSKVIERDPMLSANILKSVNSPLYGMSKEISSIPQAIMLFGIAMIRGFAAASAIKKGVPIDLSPYGVSIDELSRVSTTQTALVREWYRNVDKTMLPLLQSCAFLMELGKLVGSLNVISTGNAGDFSRELSEDTFDVVEKKYLGSSSYEITASMFEHWNFEGALIDVLKEMANPATKNPYAQVLSVVVKAVNLRNTFSDEGMNEASALIEGFGLNKNAFDEAVLSIQASQKK